MSAKTMKIVIGVLAVALVILGGLAVLRPSGRSSAGAGTASKESVNRLSNRAWRSRTPPEAPPSTTKP